MQFQTNGSTQGLGAFLEELNTLRPAPNEEGEYFRSGSDLPDLPDDLVFGQWLGFKFIGGLGLILMDLDGPQVRHNPHLAHREEMVEDEVRRRGLVDERWLPPVGWKEEKWALIGADYDQSRG